MRNIPEERLKRRQSDFRKETSLRMMLWVTIAIGVAYGLSEFSKAIV